MKKLCISLMAVLLVFSFVAFAPAQESDAVFDNPPGDMQWVPGVLPWAMFIPHFDVDPAGGWWSGLCIHSMSISANQYKIYLCDNNGYIRGTVEGALTAYQKVAWMLTPTMCGVNKGWIVVESQFPLLGFINFGQAGVSVTTLGPFRSQ
jgi:hypothetical protein